MECDRKGQLRLQISKQRATIATLKKDEAYLQAELKMLTFTGNDRRHSGVAKKSETMTEAAETLQFNIQAILNDIRQLDDAQIQVGVAIQVVSQDYSWLATKL